jgi:hypothetical protein
MHCILCIVFYALYSMPCILCILSYALYFIHCIICIVLYALYYMHCIKCIVFYALYSMHCILCIVFYALYSMHCILCIVCYALYYMHCIYVLDSMHWNLTMILSNFKTRWHRPTNRPTDRQTDRPTDRRTLSLIELLSQLKNKWKIHFWLVLAHDEIVASLDISLFEVGGEPRLRLTTSKFQLFRKCIVFVILYIFIYTEQILQSKKDSTDKDN